MNAGSWVARRRAVAIEPGHGRHASGPRFERFAAAMEAMPPPAAQVLPDAGPPPADPPQRDAGLSAVGRAPDTPSAPRPAYLRPAEPIRAEAAWAERSPAQPTADTEAADADTEAADAFAPPPMSGAAAGSATVIPRRPVVEEGKRSRGDVPWLGIGSWLLLCGALFASLVGWPDQGVLDRVMVIWSGESPSATIARVPPQPDSMPAPREEGAAVQGMTLPLPANGPNVGGAGRRRPARDAAAARAGAADSVRGARRHGRPGPLGPAVAALQAERRSRRREVLQRVLRVRRAPAAAGRPRRGRSHATPGQQPRPLENGRRLQSLRDGGAGRKAAPLSDRRRAGT